MPRDTRTTSEFITAAMLMGKDWSYDWVDHTFNRSDIHGSPYQILCADTLAPLSIGPDIVTRTELVQKGLLGPSDAYPTQTREDQVPDNREDDPQATAASGRRSTGRKR